MEQHSERRIIYDIPFILLLIFLFIDYVRPQDIAPGIASFKIGMAIQILLFLYLVLKGKFLNFINIQTKLFLTLVLLMAIHVPIAVNNYWAFQTLRAVALYFIVYMSIISFADSLQKIEKFIQIWMILIFLCGIIGLINGGSVPNSAYLGDQNDFALAMTMAIPFSYFMFLGAPEIRKKVYYLFGVGTLVSANVISFSRGGFIGLTSVFIYCWFKSPKKILSGFLMMVLIGGLYFAAPASYWDRIRSIKEENIEQGTGEARWYSWKLAMRMFRSHPLIGVGPGNYPIVVEDYQTEEELLYRPAYRRNMWGRAAHSLYFTLLSELGLTGLLLFFGMLVSCYRDVRRLQKEDTAIREIEVRQNLGHLANNSVHAASQKSRYMLSGIIGSLFGFLVSATFLSVPYYPHIWILIGLLTATTNAIKSRNISLERIDPWCCSPYHLHRNCLTKAK
jgi:O-antigen ligase